MGMAFLVASILFSCGTDTDAPTEQQGLVTTVKEVQPNEWRIADEQVVADTTNSRVITETFDGLRDTFTLAEVRQALEDDPSTEAWPDSTASTTENNQPQQRNGYYRPHYGGFSILQYGLMSYFISRSFRGSSGFSAQPNSRYYVNNQTYNRVNNSAGTTLRNSANSRSTRTTRSNRGRSGFGSGRSTRSYGG